MSLPPRRPSSDAADVFRYPDDVRLTSDLRTIVGQLRQRYEDLKDYFDFSVGIADHQVTVTMATPYGEYDTLFLTEGVGHKRFNIHTSRLLPNRRERKEIGSDMYFRTVDNFWELLRRCADSAENLRGERMILAMLFHAPISGDLAQARRASRHGSSDNRPHAGGQFPGPDAGV